MRALSLALVLCACQAKGPNGGVLDAGPAPSVGEATLRRLTRDELDATARALVDPTAPPLALPADETSLGYDTFGQGQVVSPLLEEALLEAAFSLAERVDVRTLAGCAAADDGEACAARLREGFARAAYRRPLTGDETDHLRALLAAERAKDDEATALRTLLAAVLSAPQVLYRVEHPASAEPVALLDGFSVATRLSFFFWAQGPDAALLDAAAAGELSTAPGVERQARRLLADPRAGLAVERFHLQWLELGTLGSSHKSAAFPRYDLQRSSMSEEARRLARWAVLEGDGAFERLLTARTTFIDAELAKLYAFPEPESGWLQVSTQGTARVGALTLAAVLASHAKSDQTSPVLRGKLVRQRLLGQEPPPPPGDVVVSLAPPTQGTTREREAAHTTDARCASCHRLLDPVGFGLERYDAVGAYRPTENGAPVDDRGELLDALDTSGPFTGAAELSARLAGSDAVRECYARQLFRFGFGRGETSDDEPSVRAALARFRDGAWSVRELMVAYATSDAFRYTRQVAP
ncbi:MAG: DUF1592 domain-containing protein [Myxococcaceae bacterium]|nr:DUF1592 domain-containing protein [Myxococcaceae bacterium]